MVKGKGNTFVVGSILGPLFGAPLAAHFVGAGQQLGGRELVQTGHDGALLGRGLVARGQGSFRPVPRVPPKLLRGLARHVVQEGRLFVRVGQRPATAATARRNARVSCEGQLLLQVLFQPRCPIPSFHHHRVPARLPLPLWGIHHAILRALPCFSYHH